MGQGLRALRWPRRKRVRWGDASSGRGRSGVRLQNKAPGAAQGTPESGNADTVPQEILSQRLRALSSLRERAPGPERGMPPMPQEHVQFLKMTTMPVGKLIASLAVPTIVSMLVTSIYNMADTYFVSQLGTSASGAVGVVFSLMALIQAVGFTIGMGSGTWISRLLGARRLDEARTVAASGYYLSLVLGASLSVGGLLGIDPLMRLLGATDTILPYAKDYASFILFAAPVMASSFLLNNILRAEGKAQFAMVGITAGGLLNMVLDPIFIFTFKMGIAGAAIATALSQCVSFALLLSCFLTRRTTTSLHLRDLARTPQTYLRIVQNGLPSFCRQGLASVATIATNVSAAVYGDAAVAALSIVGKIFMVAFSVLIGIGQGYQPVLGYNYGAGNFDRVRAAFRFTLEAGTVLMVLGALGGWWGAPALMTWFIADDPQVVAIGTGNLRAVGLAMPLVPLMVVCNMTFQSIGKSWTALFLSAARQGIFFLPLILLMPRFFGLPGLQVTQALADLCTFVCCLPFARYFFRDLAAREAAR